MSWYQENIELPIQPLVRLLRDNGFNTESSCGHEMYVQCQYLLDGEIKRLHDLLFNNGYRNYEINISVKVLDGCLYSNCHIEMTKKA